MMIALLTLTLFITAFPYTTTVQAEEAELPFNDIEKHWAKESILKAYEKGLVDGFPDGTFRPNDIVQADQFIVMMLRAFSADVDGYTIFDPEWYEFLSTYQPGFLSEIKAAVRKNQFDFQTAKTGYWAKPYIDMLYEMPYLLEFDSVFPKDYKRFGKQIKREEAGYLLAEWFNHFEGSFDSNYTEFVRNNSGLKDFNTFTDKVGAYRASLLISGLMNGYPDGYFYPHRYVTRAEALTMVLRLRDSSFRTPYKPDLEGQYYTEVEGYITLYSDKFKYDTYNELVLLGKKHITNGYLQIDRGNTMRVFSNQEDYESYTYFTRTGMFHLRPHVELSTGVSNGSDRKVIVRYPKSKEMPNSKGYFDAILELFVGKHKDEELKKMMQFQEKNLSKQVYFTFNKKDFSMYSSGSDIVLEMYY
ncbi:S-layer homology domain-containing protein [Paenibacillus sp. IITD108]|uniref:S-layer homology domain-containing protein n=1 Tax=Paenibacillus sp. IITD108 TaxID=3116649 RepID=UPI002F428924